MKNIEWTKTAMGEWNKYEGTAQDFGPYTIEKEDDRCYSVWWGDAEIGEASNMASAKAVAERHVGQLMAIAPKVKEDE